MSIRNRVLAAVGGVGLTLAVAVTALTVGGPIGGAAAPQTSLVGAAPTATVAPATGGASTAAITSTVAFGDFGSFAFPAGDGAVDEVAFAAAGLGDPAQCLDVQGKLATNLGVTTDQLQAAIKKTLIQEIDEAEQAGKLTTEQAKTARDRVNSATDLCTGFGMHIAGSGGQRPAAGQGIVGNVRMTNSATYQAVATYFGITTDQLQQDLKDQGSLQGVAAKYGKDTTAGKAALQAAIVQSMQAELAKHGVPQAMIDRIVAEFNANFDTLYTSKMGQGMPIGPGGPGKQRPGGPRTGPSPSTTPPSQ